MGTPLPTIATIATKPGNHGAVRAGIAALRNFLSGTLGEDGEVATALATLGALGSRIQAVSTAPTMAAADRGKIFVCAGTWTFNLVAVATAGAGFSFIVANTSTGVITLDGAASETINGATTLVLPAACAALLVCDGTAWSAFVIKTDAIDLISAQTITGTKDFTGSVSVLDGGLTVRNTSDPTRRLLFSTALISASTSRTLSAPNMSGTISVFHDFATRSAALAWLTAEAVPDGTVISIGGFPFRKKAGATAISDMSGWVPAGAIYPDHWAENTSPGTTDMRAAILAAAGYAGYGGAIFGSGAVYAVSDQMDISSYAGLTFSNLQLTAIGTWTAGKPFFLLSKTSAARVDMTFDLCNFEGATKANGVYIKNCSRVTLRGCRSHATPLFAVQTNTSAGELLIDGCNFRQWFNGETGWDVAANRTANLIDISTPDAFILNTTAAYALVPLNLTGPFNHIQILGSHFYNDGFTPASGQAYVAKINARDVQIIGCYFDSGMTQIDSQTTGIIALNHFFKNSGAATNTNAIEFVNSASVPDLSGLSLSGNHSNGYASAAAIVIFTGSFDADLQLVVGTPNVHSTGALWTGIPTFGVGAGDLRLQDNKFLLWNNADPTKIVRFGLGSVPSGTTTTYFLPNTGGTLIVNNGSATISGLFTFTTTPKIDAGTPFGYAPGRGGPVVQSTSRTTGVTLNKVTGKITLVSGAGSATGERFTVTNSQVTADSIVTINVVKGMSNLYTVVAEPADAGGSFDVTITKISGSATEAPVLKFTVWQAQVA